MPTFSLCAFISISPLTPYKSKAYIYSAGLYLLSDGAYIYLHRISCNWKNKYKYKPGLIDENISDNFSPTGALFLKQKVLDFLPPYGKIFLGNKNL